MSLPRYSAEKALRESEQQFRPVADNMRATGVEYAARMDIHDYYNARWFEYTGLSFEETQGEGWNNVLHPDDQARRMGGVAALLATGRAYEIEYRFRRTDGAYRWFIGRALPLS